MKLAAPGGLSVKGSAALVSLVGLLALGLTVGTFFTMLGLGVLHSRIDAIPALGFADSFFVNIGLWLIGLRGYSASSK